MAKKTIKAQMKQRRDTKANWAATNPVLLDGELGIVSDDPNLYKVGDGATAWNSLPFRGFDGTLAQELGTSPNAVISQKVVSEKLTELESEVFNGKKESITLQASGTNKNETFKFSLKKGKSYIFRALSAVGQSVQSRLQDGTIVENFGSFNANQKKLIIPTQDAEYIGGYSSGLWELQIYFADDFVENQIAESFAIENLYKRDFKFNANLYEKGGLDASSVPYDSSSRARTKGVLRFPYDIEIVSEGEFFVYLYDSENKFNALTSWAKKTSIKAAQGFKLILSVSSSDSAERTIEELIELVSVKNTSPIIDLIQKIDENSFEWGDVYTDGNNGEYEKDFRIRTRNIYYASEDVFIRSKSQDIAIVVNLYDSNGKGTQVISWSQSHTIPQGSYYRILLRNTTGVKKSLSDMYHSVDIYSSDKVGQSAHPNVIYQSREGSVDDMVVPPNSKWGVAMAARNEYDRIRFTIRKTSDGYYVAVHDATINAVARNSDGSSISEPISVESSTLAVLDSFDWGIAYGDRYKGAKVPRLEDCLHFANMYNLGVSIETNFTPNDEDVAALYALFVKYNVIENLILIYASNEKFRAIDDRISYFYGEEIAHLERNADYINSFKSDKNKVYVCLYPFGDMPTKEYLELCSQNGWYPYFSAIYNIDKFIEVGWDKGVYLLEAKNVGVIKTTSRKIAEGYL